MANSPKKFNPAEFVETASQLLAAGEANQATYRTVAGRSYYGVYGYLRQRLCEAKKSSPAKLFGRRGRHADLIRALPKGGRSIRAVSPYLNALNKKRVQADYKYRSVEHVGVQLAEAAVQEAEQAIEVLKDVPESEYAQLPLAPDK